MASTTAVTRQTERNVARPLHILVPLIKKDLDRAQEAADLAAEPFKMAAAEKFAEAREQMTYSEFLSWAHRNFDIRETQAKHYLSLGKYKEINGGARHASLSEFIRATGGSPRGSARGGEREWREPVDEVVSRARREMEQLREAELTRQQEREAERQLALRLIDIGFKVLAKELHPDKGGTRDAMSRLSRVRDRLKQHA